MESQDTKTNIHGAGQPVEAVEEVKQEGPALEGFVGVICPTSLIVIVEGRTMSSVLKTLAGSTRLQVY